MKKISCNTYDIHINNWDAVNKHITKGNYSSIIIIVDENTTEHCLPSVAGTLTQKFDIIEVESGEINKELDTCKGIWETMIDFGADRHSLCINLGGGVIGDMGGFTASTFMRGMDFIQMPTTLLSQVDASVGGKLGVDFNTYKNLIGVIKNPGAVFIFTEFLDTLPEEQIQSGFAEVIKHGLIKDADAYYRDITIRDFASFDWEQLVYDSVLIKKSVTDEDPEERGLRKILNFGHTLGHAIESHSLDTPAHLLHGEAIAIGMVMEAYLSCQKGYISESEVNQLKSSIIDIYGHHPDRIPELDTLISLMSKDKKNKGGVIMFSLLEKIGVGNYDQEMSIHAIERAIGFYTSS
ncbi:MAG: 3-dehydroquinate synthase [Halioglobus sp.]|jgi:3-dehydroquinate synthase